MKNILEIKQLAKKYQAHDGNDIVALDGVNVKIQDGEFVSVVGPSGCGKSTLINLIAGFEKPSKGTILFDGKKVEEPGRDRGVVFQQYTSFPWMSVKENIEFGMRLVGIGSSERKKISKIYLKATGLEGFEDEYPKNLSGGMQQRMALARTLCTDPEMLLMDEPFGALDTQTRRFMQDILLQIWDKARKTVLFVTHDVDEALFMSDTVLIMSKRPGTILEEVAIDLPRPRTIKIEFSKKYIDLKKHVQEVISNEAMKRFREPVQNILHRLY